MYPNAPLGLMYKGDPGFPTNNSNYFNNYNVVSPRFGLVWDPNGDSRQTIRAGFGIYNDTAILWRTAHHMLNSPFGQHLRCGRAERHALASQAGTAVRLTS